MKAARDADSVALVINAGARLAAAGPEPVVDKLQKAGLPISAVHLVRSGADLASTLEDVAADGHDLVVVGGGDGTVSFAAGRLAGTGTVLGASRWAQPTTLPAPSKSRPTLMLPAVRSPTGRW